MDLDRREARSLPRGFRNIQDDSGPISDRSLAKYSKNSVSASHLGVGEQGDELRGVVALLLRFATVYGTGSDTVRIPEDLPDPPSFCSIPTQPPCAPRCEGETELVMDTLGQQQRFEGDAEIDEPVGQAASTRRRSFPSCNRHARAGIGTSDGHEELAKPVVRHRSGGIIVQLYSGDTFTECCASVAVRPIQADGIGDCTITCDQGQSPVVAPTVSQFAIGVALKGQGTPKVLEREAWGQLAPYCIAKRKPPTSTRHMCYSV